MKDVLLSILGYLPNYFSDVGRSLLAPKRFARTLEAGGNQALHNAFVFAALTIALMAVVPTAFLGKTEIWDKVVLLGAYFVVGAGVVAALLFGSWRVVGARQRETPFFAIALYQIFTAAIIGYLLDIAARGAFAVVDPDYYKVWHAATATLEPLPRDALGNIGFRAYLAVEAIGLGIATVWQVIAWGAFRQLFGLGRGRSAAAFVIALVLVVPSMLLLGAVLKGLAMG